MATPAVFDTRERFAGSFQKTVTINRVRYAFLYVRRENGRISSDSFLAYYDGVFFFFLIFRVIFFFLHNFFGRRSKTYAARPTVSRPSSLISNANGIRCADVLV